jgi:glucose-1-phosphate adenylyltransferase
VHIPEGMEIGYDADLDRERGFTITENGIVVIPTSSALAEYEVPVP